jgi:hypothetical protein
MDGNGTVLREIAGPRFSEIVSSASLRARTWGMQKWECGLRTLTHNLMLLAAA